MNLLAPTSPYVLSVCKDMSAWDALVSGSPQGHVFSSSAYLQSLAAPHRCYIVSTPQGEMLAGAAVMGEGNRMDHAPFAFTPHQGILFAQCVTDQAHQKRLTTEFRLTEFLIDALLSEYTNFSMSLSPFFGDLRPFLWHNYGQDGQPHFEVRQRYTGHMTLTDFELSRYLASVRSVRRQEFKKTPAVVVQSDDLDLFLGLYQQTFERQGIEVDSQTTSMVRSICSMALEKGYGHLSCAEVDGRAASMAFFVQDAGCAYYLFGANDPEMRDANASSRLLIDNIKSFAEQGIKRFDFVGVNSPQRGDFKLSFNAELVPYQEVHLVTHA
jgi:lipid II:glycine glycyltransferase (peptidoglycan interpeptide bridge formation enzyme)